jgi:hypothetical protein
MLEDDLLPTHTRTYTSSSLEPRQVMLEDDLLPAPDLLAYMRHGLDVMQRDPKAAPLYTCFTPALHLLWTCFTPAHLFCTWM